MFQLARLPAITALAPVAALALLINAISCAAVYAGKGLPDASPPPAPRSDGEAAAIPDTPTQRAELLAKLYGYLSTVEDADQARTIVASIERLWLHSGSPTTDLLMERAAHAIASGSHGIALKFLNTVVRLQPDFAEGWNRRAYVFYARNEPRRALDDLRRTLTIEPNHFQALESMGTILITLGEKKAALEAYRKLRQVHPQAAGVSETIEELTRDVEGQPI